MEENDKYMRIYAEDDVTTHLCARNSHFACGVARLGGALVSPGRTEIKGLKGIK
jgi:hypothetical protein